MGTKLIKIQDQVYDALTEYRDDNDLASYTEAIRELLAFYNRAIATHFEWRNRLKITGPFIGDLGRSNQEKSSLNVPSLTVET